MVYATDGRPIGTKKTMVFYRGRAPAGAKTKWKLNEYKAFEDDDATAAPAAPAPPSHALQVTNSCMAPVSRQKCLLITSLSANYIAHCSHASREGTGTHTRTSCAISCDATPKGALLSLFLSADVEPVQPVSALHQVRVPAAVRSPPVQHRRRGGWRQREQAASAIYCAARR